MAELSSSSAAARASAFSAPGGLRLLALGGLLLVACILFMTVGARGSWAFILWFRGEKLAALLIVGASVAVSTLIFQTACGNRILTPAIMGVDALYVLIRTVLVFVLGGVGFASLPAEARFALDAGVLTGAAALLFGLVLGREARDVQRMVLAGMVMGVLFRSLASFLQRLIDPTEFSVVQSVSFARFNAVDGDLLWIAGGLCLVCLGVVWRMRHALDVLALGREASIGLGLDHGRMMRRTLMLSAALVAVSTALVGPVAFFGLLVTNLAHLVMRSHRHAVLLPASSLLAALILVAGQTLFERALGMAATLSVAVEFLGGLVFLFLLLRPGAAR